MIIPPSALSADTLQGIIEEFVSREGTDYGDGDFSLADKINQVREEIERGRIAIVFDPDTETCDLVPVNSRRYRELLSTP